MVDRELWTFINSFAPWLSAVGTIAAVITSLYLALRDVRITLKVTAGVRVLFMEGGSAIDGTKMVSLDVTNLGRRVVTITTVYWKTGIFRGKTYAWIPPQSPYSAKVPVKLHDGDNATFLSTMAQFEPNFQQIVKDALSGRASQLKARFIRVGVSTSTGEHVEARVEKGLRDQLLQMVHQASSAGRAGRLESP